MSTAGGRNIYLLLDDLAQVHYVAMYFSELFLETPDSFCTIVPSNNEIELPAGCTYNNQSFYDPGSCQSVGCHTGEQEEGESECADSVR